MDAPEDVSTVPRHEYVRFGTPRSAYIDGLTTGMIVGSLLPAAIVFLLKLLVR